LWGNDPQEFILIVVRIHLFSRRSKMFIPGLGAILFGLAIGWITYRVLRSREGAAVLSDLITVLGILGGAAVIALFKSDVLFGLYSLGLVIGFFAYFAVSLRLYGKQELQPWGLGRIAPTSTPTPDTSTPTPDTSIPTSSTDVGNRGRKGTSSTQ
jgi:hypothetical protein